MRRILFITTLIFCLCLVTNAQENKEPFVSFMTVGGKADGKKFLFKATELEVNKTPSWNGENNPRLSVGEAIKIANKQFSEIVEDKNFEFYKIELKTFKGNETDKWIYIVTFRPNKAGTYIGYFDFSLFVLMNGETIKPEIKTDDNKER